MLQKKASGAALGLVGIASYIGAGLQDVVSCFLIENDKSTVENISTCDFTIAKYFWVGVAIISVALALLVWNSQSRGLK